MIPKYLMLEMRATVFMPQIPYDMHSLKKYMH